MSLSCRTEKGASCSTHTCARRRHARTNGGIKAAWKRLMTMMPCSEACVAHTCVSRHSRRAIASTLGVMPCSEACVRAVRSAAVSRAGTSCSHRYDAGAVRFRAW